LLFHLSLDATDCRVWLLDLLRHIREAGHEVVFDIRPGPLRSTPALSLILALEQRLFHLAGASPLAPLDPATLPGVHGVADVRFELSRAAREGVSLFIGEQAGVAHLPEALMQRAALGLSWRMPDGTCAAQGVPAISDPDSLWRSVNEASGRIATLMLMATDGQGTRRPVMPLPPPMRSVAPWRFFLDAFLRKSLARILPGRFRQEHWRIGIRPRPSSPLKGAALGLEGFNWLPDDGTRYYADPVLVEHEGRSFLFLEEYPYATARGVIAYTELLPSGEMAFAPRVIITREGHLSFPIIFRHQGEFYMMPENASEGHLPLYRARRFPDDWEEMEPLVNAPLHDATIMEQDGCFWLLANLAVQDGSSCDVLVAYSAPSPLGPYTPHPANPLMLDARFTRGGGAVLDEAGTMVRFTQDCCAGYGRFLRINRIGMTPAGAFQLEPLAAWHPPRRLAGLHSYACDSRFEGIDVLGGRRQMPN
jgi:hypothetical protein